MATRGTGFEADVNTSGDGILYGGRTASANLRLRSTRDSTKGYVMVPTGETLKPEGTGAFILPQTGSTNPVHSAPEGTLYWSTTNNEFYINKDGSTGWEQINNALPIRNRTLSVGDFNAFIGAPALTPYLTSAGTGQGFLGWALDGASDEAITATFQLPSDFQFGSTQLVSVRLYFLLAVAAGSPNAVRLRATVTYITEGDTLVTSGNNTGSETIVTDVSSGAQYRVYGQLFESFQPVNDIDGREDLIQLTILRLGGAATDTYNSDIALLGAVIQYDADWAV